MGRRVATVVAIRLLVAAVVAAAIILWVATGLQTANGVVGLVAAVGAIIGYVLGLEPRLESHLGRLDRRREDASATLPDSSGAVAVTRPAGDWSRHVDPDRPVTVLPDLVTAVKLFGTVVAAWVACTVGAFWRTGWRWPGIDGAASDESLFWGLVALTPLSAVVAAVVGWAWSPVEAVHESLFSTEATPRSRRSADNVLLIVFMTVAAIGLLVVLAYPLSSTAEGFARYRDPQPWTAVLFGLAAVGVAGVWMACARLGFVWAQHTALTAAGLRDRSPWDKGPRRRAGIARYLRGLLTGNGSGSVEAVIDPATRVVEPLLAIPSARIFTAQRAVMVVVVGRRVVVLAFLPVPPGRYARRGADGLSRDGQPFAIADNVMARARETLRLLSAALPSRADLRGLVVLWSPGDDKEPVQAEAGPGLLQLVTGAPAEAVVAGFLAAEPHDVIDCTVVLQVWRITQAKPAGV